MADKKSLSDLGELTNPKPEAAPAPEVAAEAEAAVPGAPAREASSRGRKGSEAPDDHGASTQGPQIAAVLREQQLDKHGRAYATGRRKDAVARVWLKPGSGKIVINGREQEVYFARPTLRLIINQVFDVTDRRGQYDVEATVKGGGLSGQAGAVRHGISTGADPLRAGAAHHGQARRLPHPRPARRRAQEVRPRQGPPQLPVLEALSYTLTNHAKGGRDYPGRPFSLPEQLW